MHIPVLKDEVIGFLNPQPNQNFIDCTLGFAGHAAAILQKNGPEGRVLGIERDNEICEQVKKQNIERLLLVNDSYVNLKKIVQREKFQPVQGILFDLGMSSWHIDSSNRGFSFQKDEELDMRYDKDFQKLKAEDIINKWPQKEIEKILREYGEERFAGRIARVIAEAREQQPIKTTFQLSEIIRQVVPKKFQYSKTHPATKTFQALRVVVNSELENIKSALPQALETLKPGGRLAVISFHSLEDRIVKNFFRDQNKNNSVKILTKKPITPTLTELLANQRSRSAKLRAIEKI